MRPVTVRMSAAGNSNWIPLNRLQWLTNVGLFAKISSGAVLTYSVQHTADDIYRIYQDFTIARVTTTATVTQVNHGLSVGDWVWVTNAGAPLDGQYTVVTVADANTFTYTVDNSGATSAGANRMLQKARVFEHAVLTGLSVSEDSNYAFPAVACRLVVSAYTGGFVELTILQGN